MLKQAGEHGHRLCSGPWSSLHSISEAIFVADRIVAMATLPGSIKEVIEVPLPHPRDRSGPELVALERSIKQLVREEVRKLGVM